MASKSFAQDVTNFVQKTGLRLDTLLRKVAFDCFAGVILRSPVDTGRFRSNWRVAVNRVDIGFDMQKGGRAAGSSIGVPLNGQEVIDFNVAVAGVNWGDSVHISNNLPYALFLEHGGSRQNPNGILSRTFDEVVANLQQSIAAVQAQVP